MTAVIKVVSADDQALAAVSRLTAVAVSIADFRMLKSIVDSQTGLTVSAEYHNPVTATTPFDF
jgi:hypothetical protein